MSLNARRPSRRIVVALLMALLVFGAAAGIVTGGFATLAHQGLYATGLWSRGGASTVPPGTFDTPASPATSPTPDSVGLPTPVLLAATPVPGTDAARVTARVDGLDRSAMKGSFSGIVLDVGTGSVLYGHRARRAYIPASTMKLLTSAAALSLLGPEHRFTTQTVAGGGGRIVLVGGGDPYLAKETVASTYPARASVADLARVTATRLKHDHQRQVVLGYDASLFTGPDWNESWPTDYRDQVTPVSALWVDEGRVKGGSPGPRVADPAKNAAVAFADALGDEGITVTSIDPARAPTGAAVLGSVQSMPLERMVEHLLLTSDNDAAETVFRQAALGAQRPGSFTAAQAAVKARLMALGAWDPGTEIDDGSGLSRETKVPADAMAKVLRLATQDRHPELRALLTGLPVAGVEGSLGSRFFDDASRPGRGMVRGKTGTLRKVHSLAGFVRTQDGSLLVYAFLVNNPDNDYAARVWLDRVTAALSECGCRST